MSSIVFAGGETTSFISLNAQDVTTPNSFRDQAKSSMLVSGTGMLRTLSVPTFSHMWLHFDAACSAITDGRSVLKVMDSFGDILLECFSGGRIQFHDGSHLDTDFFTGTGLTTYDIQYYPVGGTFALYMDEQLITTAVKPHNANPLRIELRAGADTGTHFSQVIMADNKSTLGWKLTTLEPIGAGDMSQWSGNFNNVTAIPNDPALTLATPVAGRTTTWKHAAVDNLDVIAVVMSVKAKIATANSPAVHAVARINGTDHTADLDDLNTTEYSATQAIMEVNPVTYTAWTPAILNATQFGVKSV